MVLTLKHPAVAGSLESSDAIVSIEPGNNGIELTIESTVMNQYGRQIKASVLNTLEQMDVKNARISIVDKGAVDCTLRARVECAVFRAADQTENLPWGVKI